MQLYSNVTTVIIELYYLPTQNTNILFFVRDLRCCHFAQIIFISSGPLYAEANRIIMLVCGWIWQAEKSQREILVDLYGDDDDDNDDVDDIGIPPAITTSSEAPFVPSPKPSSSPLPATTVWLLFNDLPQPFNQRLWL